MQTLTFEKISQFNRLGEAVSVSIPFAKSRLTNINQLTLKDGAQALNLQARALAHWDDGSIKWLLVHFQPDLPGNSKKTLHFEMSQANPIEPEVKVKVKELAEGIRVDTGVLSFLVPRSGFLPLSDIKLHEKALWQKNPFQGFALTLEGQKLFTQQAQVTLELEETGPLRVVILVHGKHQREDGQPYLEFTGRITAYAGKPHVEVEHQFLHKEEEDELLLKELKLEFQPESPSQSKHALGQGFYRTEIQESNEALEMALTADTLLYQANEHFIDSFYGDFWVDWQDEHAGLCLSMYQAHQHFPKTLLVNQKGITASLYPKDAEPVSLLQGVAKTHRLQLHFHSVDESLEELSTRSLQFQLPDRPSLSRAWYETNNPWLESYFPEKLPGRLMTYLAKLHDGRPKAMGMLHFGDAPDSHYSNQGRGEGQLVWVNNEYDRPHACTLFYGLTGQRRMLDSALVSARHWLDVDVCHYSPDPLVHQGLKIHTANHITGKVTPSHEWVEGFLDYYFLTGRTEALKVVNGIARNILRHMEQPEMRAFGSASVREAGWALRAMVGMYLGTNEKRWFDEAKRIVEMFLGWQEEYGALLAPYTSHSMPRVPFMISLTLNSFARYLLIVEDERLKTLIVETVDDLLEHCLGPDGIFFYKELPSLQRSAPTPHVLESLTHAYRLTGNQDYLKTATRQFAALVSRGAETAKGGKFIDSSGAVISGQGGGRVFASKYSSILLFASEAAPLGLLDWYDYPY